MKQDRQQKPVVGRVTVTERPPGTLRKFDRRQEPHAAETGQDRSVVGRSTIGDRYDGGGLLRAFHAKPTMFCISGSQVGANALSAAAPIIRRHLPLELHEVPSRTEVLNWTVPLEWNIHDAYVARRDGGTRIVDFRKGNLHVVQYSRPVDAVIPLAELRPHLHTLPDHPTG
jgi:hypothetical protein